jgi:hypothetical protein
MIKTLSSNLINYSGYSTNRRIIVIESDDWGSIRMPSKEVYERMLKKGIRVDLCPYNRYDSLASEEDLEALFNVLVKFNDKNGNHPIITANTVMANPDFNKIRGSKFKKYYFERFTETLSKYPKHQNSFELWSEGINEGLFHPQFHGREHVNINLWLRLLQNKHEVFEKAFDNCLWGLGPSVVKMKVKINIQATFDAIDSSDIGQHKTQIIEGLNLFKDLFGFESKSFIANNFIWDSGLNESLNDNGVIYLQGMKYQLYPILDKNRRDRKRHYIGDRNNFKQVYLVRNCSFEPTQYRNMDNVNHCLSEISNAFFWNKPAIISMHRLNFVGFINENNRTKNLKLLNSLISQILYKWPEVEFMTSDKLGSLIKESSSV